MTVLKGEGTHPILFETASVPVRAVTHTTYRAVPDLKGEWPTVMVVGGAKGLSSQVRDLCRRLARHGIAAVAPDLYSGSKVPFEPEAARQKFAALDALGVRRVLRDIGRYLADGLGPWDTAEEGFGVLAMQEGAAHGVFVATMFDSPLVLAAPNLTESSPGMDEDFEPLPDPPGVIDALPTFTEPLLGLIGKEDEFSPVSVVMEARQAAPHSQWVLYEGLGHDYLDDGTPGFDQAAFTDSLERIIEFFGKNL